jgi:hypothetical protein
MVANRTVKHMGGSHNCAAIGCTKMIPLAWLMCRSHWFSVPMQIRHRVWETVHAGGDPYVVAVQAAIDALAEKEKARAR